MKTCETCAFFKPSGVTNRAPNGPLPGSCYVEPRVQRRGLSDIACRHYASKEEPDECEHDWTGGLVSGWECDKCHKRRESF